jgi:transposase
MSLQPQAVYIVPAETDRVAHAIFPKPNPIMQMYDEFGVLFNDADFADLFSPRGQPALAPVRLALASLLQFLEGLTDRQAADAVRTRIDWKYLLCLDLTDPGFDHTVLSEFRTRLLAHNAERRLFDTLLAMAQDRGLLKAGGRQRTDSTHILSAARTLTRLECVLETLRHALNVLAGVAPAWVLAQTTAEWVERYGARASEYRLPKSETKRRQFAEQVGRDGIALLTAVYSPTAPLALRELAAVQILRRVWIQNFMILEGQLQWRGNNDTPPTSQYIGSPYDTETRFANKGSLTWTGFKVHLTETCDEERPNLITNVATTAASVADDAVTDGIHASLAEAELLPDKHIADTGFVNSKLFVESQGKYKVHLIGPTRSDNQWQAKAGQGFAAQNFVIDWVGQRAICPQGRTSSSWTPAIDKGTNQVIKIKFGTRECKGCPRAAQCTRSAPPRRTITIRPQAQHEALLAGRQREQSAGYRDEYARRAGIEGTIAQGVRRCGMRRSHYYGQTKIHLQHLMVAAALNLIRLIHWLGGEPKAKTAVSAFARLYQPAA